MRLAMSEMLRPLHPNQKTLLRVRGAIAAAVLIVLGLAADSILARNGVLPFGAIIGGAFVLAALAAFVLPPRRYRAWGYRMDEDELRIGSGLLIRTEAIVPFGRVQHIDIVRGPLQRHYGLGSLVLHTAGTRAASMLLPGLEITEAERMRDHIRSKIREDLV